MEVKDVVVKEGYELMGIVVVEGMFHAIINRHTSYLPYIFCYGYCIADGTWAQGHYHESYEDALVDMAQYMLENAKEEIEDED